jgi:hypothetical protein
MENVPNGVIGTSPTEEKIPGKDTAQWQTILKFLAEIINRLDRIEMKVTRMQSKIKSDEQVI